jgi:AcrR family transcriptional regulator
MVERGEIEEISKRSYHHGDLSEALIEQAMASVDAVGADHVSLRAVAAAVGVSPSAAYHHFADKDALMKAVSAHGFVDLDSFILQRVSEDVGQQDPLEIMRHSANAYICYAVDHPYLFQVMFSELKAPVRPKYIEGSILSVLSHLQSEYGFAEADLHLLESVLLAAVHGIAALVIEGRMEREQVPAAVDMLTTIILKTPAKE